MSFVAVTTKHCCGSPQQLLHFRDWRDSFELFHLTYMLIHTTHRVVTTPSVQTTLKIIFRLSSNFQPILLVGSTSRIWAHWQRQTHSHSVHQSYCLHTPIPWHMYRNMFCFEGACSSVNGNTPQLLLKTRVKKSRWVNLDHANSPPDKSVEKDGMR